MSNSYKRIAYPYCDNMQTNSHCLYHDNNFSCPYTIGNPMNIIADYESSSNQNCPFTNETVYNDRLDYLPQKEEDNYIKLKDYGPHPFAVDINAATKQNDTFRTALWTGKYLQITLMSIEIGGEIGLEIHPNLEQFIRIEQGEGIVQMGNRRDRLYFTKKVNDDSAFVIPAGTWHNLINTGYKPLKLYSIYAPPQHPHGTIHETKEDADANE